jgi:hypothetical protein
MKNINTYISIAVLIVAVYWVITKIRKSSASEKKDEKEKDFELDYSDRPKRRPINPNATIIAQPAPVITGS